MNNLDTRPPAPARRSRRTIILVTSAVVLIIAGAVGLALFQPWKLFTRSTVNEAVPGVAASIAPAPGTSGAAVAPSAAPTAGATTEPAPVTIQAPPPAAEPVVLGTGTFVDGEHATTGTATILQLPDGTRYLRLENFSTSDGPDVDVALSDQTAGGDEWGKYDDGRYLGLGDLKGTDGNQNYEIPADADLAGLTSVVIWCDRFNVAFGTAAVTL